MIQRSRDSSNLFPMEKSARISNYLKIHADSSIIIHFVLKNFPLLVDYMHLLYNLVNFNSPESISNEKQMAKKLISQGTIKCFAPDVSKETL